MRRTKEEAGLTRQHILDAALGVFSQKGYEGARLEEIAEAAGVTRGAVYHHFNGKAELFMELIEQANQLDEQVIARAVAEGGDFLQVVQRILVYSLRLLEEDAGFRQVLALLMFKTGVSPELTALERRRQESAIQQVQMIAGFFKMGVEQGALHPDLDPTTAARAFLAYEEGLVRLWLANPDAFSIAQQAGPLSEVFMHGIARN